MADGSSVQRVIDHLLDVVSESSAGHRLPSTRSVAAELGVGPVTVQHALDHLVSRGLVETRPGVGAFVTARRAPPRSDTAWQELSLGVDRVDALALTSALNSNTAGILQMGAGHLDETLRPDSRLAQSMARAARRPGVWAAPPVRGVPELRTWFADQLRASIDDITITTGTQGTLSSVLRALLQAGEPLLVATPAYPGVFSIARSAGLIPFGVPGDEEGVRVDLVDRALDRCGARVMYLQPSLANPDGSVLSNERRTALLQIAHRRGLVLIEDDCSRWLGHRDQDVPAPLRADDEHGHVVSINSLTKVTAPSLRVGAVVARGPVSARIVDMRVIDDLYVPAPLQHTAVEMVSGSGWRAHLRCLSLALSSRRAALVAQIAEQLPGCSVSSVNAGGVHLWLTLPPGVSDIAVAEQAASRKVFVVPGRRFELNPPSVSHLRLSYASLSEADAAEAVSRLAAAINAAT